jgi:hypothetical protein
MGKIEELIKELPPELQQEVEDFARFLAARGDKEHPRKPTFEWAGALKDLRDQYTSVELQHKISDWMIGKE